MTRPTSPAERRALTNRAMTEALSQLAVAGVNPVDAARQIAREAALTLRHYQGSEAAAEVLFRLADELCVTR